MPWDRDSPCSSCLPQIHILRIQPPSRCMLPPLPTNYHFNNSALKQKTNVSILQTFNFSHDILNILADKSHTCFGLFCVSLCMHTYVCGMCTGVCICSCMHACTHVCRPKVNVRYPHLSPPTLVFKAGSSIEPDPHHSSSVLGSALLQQTRAHIQIHTVISRLYADTGVHNSGPRAYMASTLPTESSCISRTLLQLTFHLPTTPERPKIMCSWVRGRKRCMAGLLR